MLGGCDNSLHVAPVNYKQTEEGLCDGKNFSYLLFVRALLTFCILETLTFIIILHDILCEPST